MKRSDNAKNNGAANPNPFASFHTTCPRCGVNGKLAVVEVTLAATGRRIRNMRSPLSPDGFVVPTNARDASTDCEVVECRACGKRFPLSEVTR
ncbi:MAG TPA: hypothetical protein VMP11_10660 [Verrucomicrobiae bacterium]|nr:hypothetical protein [Verrucomicrobiae bacterium]